MPRLAHGFVLLAVDAITMIFWFAGFIALAVWISNHIAGGNSTIKAACVFAAFEWLVLFSSVLRFDAPMRPETDGIVLGCYGLSRPFCWR